MVTLNSVRHNAGDSLAPKGTRHPRWSHSRRYPQKGTAADTILRRWRGGYGAGRVGARSVGARRPGCPKRRYSSII